MKEITKEDFVGRKFTRKIQAMQMSENFKLVSHDEDGNVTGSIGGLIGDYVVLDADDNYYVYRQDAFEKYHTEEK